MNELNFAKDDFPDRLGQIQRGLNEGKWVNDKLDIVKKDCGFLRFLKVIILPLTRVFGADPFSHIRVNNVAMQIYSKYEIRKDGLTVANRDQIVKILTSLKTKTGNKYASLLDLYINAVRQNAVVDSSKLSGLKPTVPAPPPLPKVETKEQMEREQNQRLANSLKETAKNKKTALVENKTKSLGDLVGTVKHADLFQKRKVLMNNLPKHLTTSVPD